VQNLPFILAALACPIAMGLMMFFMMRPGSKQPEPGPQPGARQDEIAELRAEVARLRSEHESSPEHTPRVGR
jgi:hypothetical protein